MDEIVKSFDDTYNSEEAYEMVAQIGDVALDVIIDGGALDGVPVIGLLKGVYKTTKNFQFQRLIKKVHKFIFITQDITLEERNKFIQEYTEKNKEEGCEALLAVIDRLDNVNKVDILVNLMKAKIKGGINMADFIRLCAIIDRIPFSDFSELVKYVEDYYEEGSTDVLLSAGVLFNTIIDGNEGNKYRLNSLGKILLKYGLLRDVPVETKKSTHLADMDWENA